MIEYIILYILVVISVVNGVNKNTLVSFYFLCVLVLYFILITTFRFGIGTDYFNYVNIYDEAEIGLDFKNQIVEPGYLFLNVISKLLNGGYTLVAFLSISIVFINIKKASSKFSINPTLSIPIYICMFAISHNFNIVRHGLASSFIILAISYLHSKKRLKFLMFVLIASMFHTIALIAIPLIFIDKIKVNFKTIILFFFIMFLMSEIIYNYFEVFSNMNIYNKLLFYQYDYAGGVEINNSSNKLSFGTYVNITIIFLCLLFFDKDNVMEQNLIKILILGVGFMILFRFSGVFAERFAGMFYPILIFILPRLYQNMNIKPKIFLLFFLLLYISSYYLRILINKNIYDSYQYFPYNSILY